MTIEDIRSQLTRRQIIVIALVLVLAAAPITGLLTGNTYTSGSTFETDSGLSISFEFNQTLNGNPFADANTFNGTGGTVSARSTGNGALDVAAWGVGSATTVVNDLNTTPVAVVDPDRSSRLGVNGTATEVRWDNISTDDDVVDVTTTVNTGETAGLTFFDLSPGTDYRLVNSSGDVVARATANDNGIVYIEVSSSDDFKLEAYTNEVPSISNLSPNNEVVDDTVTLAADVDDDSLPGSNISITFRVDGSTVHTTTITKSQRVNYTLAESELPGAGERTWSITATDELEGESTESSTFYVPGNMTVLNVSNTSEVVPNADVTIYTNDGAINRTADSNGNISLKDLPANQVLTFKINATGYKERTMAIPSIVQAGNAYLIPKNTTTVLNRFTLKDATGNYQPESVVYIKRPVNVNGSKVYRTVAADQFGVEGFPATLVQDQRYRITIISPDGNVAQLGKYIATQSQEIPLRPESVTVRVEGGQPIAYNATAENGNVKIQYNDPENQTEVLTVYVVNRFNNSDYLLEPQTYYSTDSLTLTEPIPGGELTDGYKVVIKGQREDGDFYVRQYIGPDQVNVVPGSLSTVWVQIFGVALVLVVGGVFSQLNVGVGAVVTSLLAGVLWYIGLLGGVATWGTIVAAMVFSVGYAMVMQQ